MCSAAVMRAHHLEALRKIFSANACAELRGTRLRDNEDEKRYPVSGWNV